MDRIHHQQNIPVTYQTQHAPPHSGYQHKTMVNTALSQSPQRDYTRENFYPPSYKQDVSTPGGYKKIVMVAILALFAMLIFSSMAYSLTDHIAGGLNIDLFGSEGEPSITATALHTVLYMLIAFIVVSIIGK